VTRSFGVVAGPLRVAPSYAPDERSVVPPVADISTFHDSPCTPVRNVAIPFVALRNALTSLTGASISALSPAPTVSPAVLL
jgi:hypothetical protein